MDIRTREGQKEPEFGILDEPRYLGVEVPPSLWPTGTRTREDTLTEVEMTHWPDTIRLLALSRDERLPKTAHELVCGDPVQAIEVRP